MVYVKYTKASAKWQLAFFVRIEGNKHSTIGPGFVSAARLIVSAFHKTQA
jgi:hypothetical protein